MQSIQCKPISLTVPLPKFSIFAPYFANLHAALASTPPIPQPARFGNSAFKTWHEKACV